MATLPFKIPESKHEVLTMIQSYRIELSTLWQGMHESEMHQIPGPQEDWSVKDLIAHITWWESFTIGRILTIAAGESLPKIDDYDALNAKIYQAQKNLSLVQVLADFENSLARVLATIETLSWEDIDGGGLTYLDAPLGRLIGGNTFGHYLEHKDDLEKFASSTKE